MKDDTRDELDDLIGGVLAEYSNAEPIHGLEDRVLNRIHMAGASRRRPWFFKLKFAIPALAALLLMGIALRMEWNSRDRAMNERRETAVSKPPSLITQPEPRPGPEIVVVEPKPRVAAKRKPLVSPKPLPKEEYFPARTPMTEEERVLAAWAMRAPSEAAQVFADLRKRSTEPIEIEPIEIPPLPTDGIQ